MFLFQQKTYDLSVLATKDSFQNLIDTFNKTNPAIMVFDTETTGLNFMEDRPFLVGIGFEKSLFVFEPNEENLKIVYDLFKKVKLVVAHNTKYDYHILINTGHGIPEDVNLGDTMTIARLTEYADNDDGISLEKLGSKYVDSNSKFAAKVIKLEMNTIERKKLNELKAELKKHLGVKNIGQIWKAYQNRVQFVEYPEYKEIFDWIDARYKRANYEDVYKASPELMTHYLADDLVITLEYLKKTLPVLEKTDPNYKIFKHENELIKVVAKMERRGLRADVNYLLESRQRVMNYINQVYDELHGLMGVKISSGQHKEIMRYFREKHNIYMANCDLKALQEVEQQYPNIEAGKVASIIIELRTLDKWLSTYINGMLNRVHKGRIHTSINNAGTVTGRVSSDMQQQPNGSINDKNGNELFHPRRVFINDDGYKTFYFDYSQMELRLQAHYTIKVAGGDENLCRAFMPFKYKSMFSGEEYQYGNHAWDSGEWVDDDGKEWKAVDLHAVTTLKAFPHLTEEHPDFKKYRKYGKVANFLKNYAGGWSKIMESLKVSEDIAKTLDKAYYEAFPKVKDYQRWVDNTLYKQGYVENIMGRRYYMQSSANFYKAYNYIVQGGCADLMKNKELLLHSLLKDYESYMLLPVHDEIQVAIKNGEEFLIPMIKQILDDNDQYLGTLPMLCDVEYTKTNWAEKEDYHG